MNYIKLCLAALVVLACGSPPGPRVGVDARSLVTLARLERATPELDYSNAGEPTWGPMRDQWRGYCGAFAVRQDGRVRLATAAHCVPDGQNRVWYFRTWGMGTATIAYISTGRDIAYLDADDSNLAPIELGPVPAQGETVRAISPLFGATSGGVVDTVYDEGWYETTQTIAQGWSGSPELDSHGRAIGVVAKCLVPEGQPCLPRHALVTGLDP